MSLSTKYPDPLVTANIYASGLLDDVLLRVVAPFRRDVQDIFGETNLWVVRYSRGGQHLKVRVHGAPEHHDQIRKLLATRAETFFESLRNVPPVSPRISKPSAPAIDVEDALENEFSDRSMVWTTYQRSHVTLGMKPWLSDDTFVALACECLARGCDLTLAAAESGGLGSLATRQKLLIELLMPALVALGLDSDEKALSYLAYHRDWLLRFFVAETAKEQQLLRHFEEKTAAIPEALESFRSVTGRLRAHPPGDRWSGALSELAAYLKKFSGRSEYDLDPFTREVSFPPAFKVLHGLANQIGMPPLQEAYVHHVLIASMEAGALSADLVDSRSAL